MTSLRLILSSFLAACLFSACGVAAPSQTSDVVVSSPAEGSIVTSPLHVEGRAKGNWFFEANIPVSLEDENGTVIAQAGGMAKSDWMTTDFVPFSADLMFATTAERGFLVIRKDNPSGLPEHDASVKIPVRFR